MISFCGLTTFARMRSDPQKSPVFALFFLCLDFFVQTRKSSLTGSKVPFCGIFGKRLLGAIFCLFVLLARYARSHKHVSYIYIIYIDNAYVFYLFLLSARSLTLAR